MSSFKLTNSNRFFLEGTNNTWMHLATVIRQLREYMCFMDLRTSQVYIEEISGGHLERIEDDSLAIALHNFLCETKVLDVSKPTIPDQFWLKNGKK